MDAGLAANAKLAQEAIKMLGSGNEFSVRNAETALQAMGIGLDENGLPMPLDEQGAATLKAAQPRGQGDRGGRKDRRENRGEPKMPDWLTDLFSPQELENPKGRNKRAQELREDREPAPTQEELDEIDRLTRESVPNMPPDPVLEELQRERMGGEDTLPQISERAEELNDERFSAPPLDPNFIFGPNGAPSGQPFQIEPQGPASFDTFGNPTTPEQEKAGADAGNEVRKNDSSRLGDLIEAIPDAEVDEFEMDQSPIRETKILPNARGKLFDLLGVDDGEHQERLALALLGFGAGVLGGGSDLGAAIGQGINQGVGAFTKTKETQRQAGLDEYDREVERADRERRIAIQDAELEMKAQEFEMKKEDAARKRKAEAEGENIVKLEREKKELQLERDIAELQNPTSGVDWDNYSDVLRWVTIKYPNMSESEAADHAQEIYTKKFKPEAGLNFGTGG